MQRSQGLSSLLRELAAYSRTAAELNKDCYTIVLPVIYFMNIQDTNFSAVGPLCSMLKAKK
jgi:hypothetical protein